MIRVKLKGDRELISTFESMPKRLHESLARQILRFVIELQRYVVTEKLQGQVLKHRTGNLGRNVVYRVEDDGPKITGFVGITKLAPYGKTHELGGTVNVKEHIRTSRLGKSFSVRSHAATYPERSFLRTSLRENEQLATTRINKAIQEAI